MRRPAALAPEPGAAQLIGEVTEPAERFGLRPGMRMGEALSRCPELALIPPDPERAERSWEEALRRLEGIGAEVESGARRRGLLRGGRPGRPLGRDRGRAGASPDGTWRARATRRRRRPLLRLCGRRCIPPASSGGRRIRVPGADCRFRCSAGVSARMADDLPNELERLGISTLGRLAGLPRDAVADRFGRLGLRALRLARGGMSRCGRGRCGRRSRSSWSCPRRSPASSSSGRSSC